MTGIFNIDRIKWNDPLRDKKINSLNSIKSLFEGLDKYIKEEHLEKVIDRYTEEWVNDKEMHELITSGVYDDKFWQNWHQKIVDATELEKVQKIYNVVEKAILKNGSQLKEALNKLREKNSDLGESNFFDFQDRYLYAHSAGSDWNYVLALKIEKDKRRNWEYKWEREAREKREARAIGPKTENHRKIAKGILAEIREAEFRAELFGKKNMVSWSNRTDCYGTKHHTISEWEQITKDSISRLDDNLLEVGKKKFDLFKELDETICSKALFLNNDNDSISETASVNSVETDATSIFDNSSDKGYDSDDNSSFVLVDDITNTDKEEAVDNKVATPKEENIEELRNKITQEITALLQKEPVVNNSDLKSENQGYLDQLKAAKTSREMFGIQMRVKLDIGEVRRSKQSSVNLDNLAEEFQNGSKTVSVNDIAKFNQNSGNSGNEEKEEEVKKAMMQQDPELYFDSFVQWVKEEEKKMEKMKEEAKVDEDSNSEIEYNDEEREFLDGKITDPQQKKEIANQIETKINVKKKSWSLWKWLREMKEWIKTRARLLRKNNKVELDQKAEQIKKELENQKNSSNRYAQQAYENNKSQVNELLAELDAISQENQTVAPNEKGFFRPEVIVPISFLVVVLAIVAAVVIRRRRKLSKVKK